MDSPSGNHTLHHAPQRRELFHPEITEAKLMYISYNSDTVSLFK